MKYKGLVFLFLFFCLMFIFNIFTPLLNDDYFVSFIWPMGGSINALPENAKRIASFYDLLESLKSYYLSWGGRIPGQSLMMFFLWQGKEYFNFFNALAFVILIAEIYWISHEGRITLTFNTQYILWIFFSLWTFNIAFTESFLWLSGACDYLWLMVFLLAFLIPYVRNYYEETLLKKDTFFSNLVVFFLGLVSGCSRETLICLVILVLSYWLYLCKARGNLQYWKITGYIGLCIGYGILIFAPGNAVRFKILSSIMDTNIFFNKSLLTYKLVELGLAFFFHLILWYFLCSFFIRYRKRITTETNKKYMDLTVLFTLVAFLSEISMFFIPSRGIRVSFVSLVFLLLAIATVFNLQARMKLCIINNNAQLLLKKAGYFYLIITIVVSLAGNYSTWNYWNGIIKQFTGNKNDVTNVVTIKVIPHLTERNRLWLYGSGFVHLTGLPLYEDGPLNLTISKYYGVKGIKVVKQEEKKS